MREQHGYGQTTAFCHCGAFTNTPFCDGTHSQGHRQVVGSGPTELSYQIRLIGSAGRID
jgi:CDGSH-type Zn-finger protein